MDYQKKYPFARDPEDFILISWERGYHNVHVHYRDRLLVAIEDPRTLLKGYQFTDEELNRVELKFSEEPMMIDVIVDGYHSPVNVSHPSRVLAGISKAFWTIFNLMFFFTLMELAMLGLDNPIGKVELVVNVAFLATYLIAHLKLEKGSYMAFYIGFFAMLISSVLYGFRIVFYGFNFLEIIMLSIRIAIILYLLTYLKVAKNAVKHHQYKTFEDEDLLDF